MMLLLIKSQKGFKIPDQTMVFPEVADFGLIEYLQIYSNLYEGDLLNCCSVSRRFYRLSNDLNLW